MVRTHLRTVASLPPPHHFSLPTTFKLSKLWVWDPGSEIREYEIRDPGVRDPGSGIRDPGVRDPGSERIQGQKGTGFRIRNTASLHALYPSILYGTVSTAKYFTTVLQGDGLAVAAGWSHLASRLLVQVLCQVKRLSI